GTREGSRVSGSAVSVSSLTRADCLYVDDDTISRIRFFTSQPDSRNSTASQSSSSGCDGGSPCEPKSSAVFTRPVPKISCQKRFTVTRAVSGFEGSTSHRARPSRLRGRETAIGGSTDGAAGVTSSRG